MFVGITILAAAAQPAIAVSGPDPVQSAHEVREHSYDVLIRRIDHFVDRPRHQAIVARLQAARSTILSVPSDDAFVAAINAILRATSGDRHLQVVIEDGHPSPSEAADGNFGIAEAQVDAAGIGLLRLTGFSGAAASVPAIDAAVAKLAHARALILDLRDNGGGGEASFARLLGHLFPTRTELNGIAWRTCISREGLRPDACEQGPARIERRFTDTPQAPALARMPIYVLVSPRTFSAAEAVAYELRERGRATIVGESTGGGGSPSAAMDLESKFAVIMPIGRLYRVTSGNGWEGSGVTPDISVSSATADQVARQIVEQGSRTNWPPESVPK